MASDTLSIMQAGIYRDPIGFSSQHSDVFSLAKHEMQVGCLSK